MSICFDIYAAGFVVVFKCVKETCVVSGYIDANNCGYEP